LKNLLNKWKSKIANDSEFLLKLCNLMLEEEKISAITNIIKLSKYKNIFREIFNIFETKEKSEFVYV
jgi:hypothetical protein